MKDTLIGWALAVLIPCALFAGVHVQSGDNTVLGNVTASTMTVTGQITGSTMTLTGRLVLQDGTVMNSTSPFVTTAAAPVYRPIFEFISGIGTVSGNWSTNSLPAGCFTFTAGTGVAGSNLFGGNTQFQDSAGEEMQCRAGRIPPGVDVTSVTVQLDAQQVFSGMTAGQIFFDWNCFGNNVATSTQTWHPASAEVITSTPIASTGTLWYEKNSIDLTQGPSGCVPGKFIIFRFRYDESVSDWESRVWSGRVFSYN